MKTKILSTFLLVIVLFTTSYSQTFDKAKLDKFFDTLAEKNKAMGSLTISKDGNILYSRAIGYSQISENGKKPSTTATRYRIGSISKMFTAVMIFQLFEEGKLQLTDTLDKFFPQIPNAKKITIGNMLNHRSGIHSFTSDPNFRTWLMNPKTQSEMLTLIAKSTPDFEPGAKESYSNAGYVLFGYIIEKITKKSYQAALKERITSKIGLSDTYLGGKTNLNDNESYSYNYAGNWKIETETDLSIPGGAGAIISNPTDLTKFINALFNVKLISQDSLNQMKTNSMGMFPFPLNDKTLYGHTGGIDGFNSMLIYLPEEKLAVAYTSNGMVYPINDILLGVFDIYRNKPFAIPTFESVAVSGEILEKYIGVYASANFPLKITVTRDAAGLLYAQATGQSAFPLEAVAQDKFKFDPAGVIVEFDAEKNQMTLKQGGQKFVFTKEK
jgi:CubicO group peptidase (beta-lactamase class C family)